MQEESVFLSTQARSNYTYACLINPYHTGATTAAGATGTFRFAKFSGLAGTGVPFLHQGPNTDFRQLQVRDSEFGAVYGTHNLWVGSNTTTVFLNNLFERSQMNLLGGSGAQLVFSNNLFWGSSGVVLCPGSNGVLTAFNNVFDSCVVGSSSAGGGVLANDFNAYLNCTGGTVPLTNAGPNRIISTNSLAWQTGALGSFYQPNNCSLINAGSVSNAALVGFHSYTTTTNQVWETNSVLDIGYHYVSVDTATGLPIDSDWDGIPDYADPDSDGDGLPDSWEITHFGSLNEDATSDVDYDDLTNLQEYQLGTNPRNWDTDDDGLSDSEELMIWVDVNNPGLGFLDPLMKQTDNTGTDDGTKDGDHDGLTNLGEVRYYGTSPTNAHTYAAGLNDAQYCHLAIVEISGQPPLPAAYQALARGLQVDQGAGLLQFNISEALPGARYDLYFVNNLVASTRQWRRVYSEIVCDANGEATIYLQQPDPWQGYFIILSAEDRDADGLTDGYEAWFAYSGGKTSPNHFDTDNDGMFDDWEAEYGIDPTSGVGPDGANGNPDDDFYFNGIENVPLANIDEFNYRNPFEGSYDPLKACATAANRAVVSVVADNAYPSCEETSFTFYRYAGSAADYSSALTVYYSVGGNLRYGTEYSLTPTPTELPRIYSVEIPANQQSVTVTAGLLGNPVPTGSKQLAVTVTPYSVAHYPQIFDPLDWEYVVDWHYNRAVSTFDFNNMRPYAVDQHVPACRNGDNSITLSGWDACNDPLTYSVLSNPGHGTLSGTPPNLTYHPALDYTGDDSFTFKVNDGLRDSDPATITILVGVPIATSSTLLACRNTDLPVTLSGSSGCDQSLTYTIVNSPQHGTLLGTPPYLTYRPTTGYEGPDAFSFKVNNGIQDSVPAVISIQVGYQPQVTDQVRITDLSRPIIVTLSGYDGCGDPLTYSIVDNPTHGVLSGTPPTVTYTPQSAGVDVFTFKANDGVRDSNLGTISGTVLGDLSAYGSCDRVNLEWTIPDDSFGHIVGDITIYRGTSPNGPFSLIATIPNRVREYPDLNVSTGITYYYRICYHYIDPGTSMTYEACSAVMEASVASPPAGGPTDIAFILDNTGSMTATFIAALKRDIASVLGCIESSAGSDVRYALVTPDEDQVNVRLAFPVSGNNRTSFETALSQLTGSDGGKLPESTDECLNTVVNALSASGRENPGACTPSVTLQINNFTGFRDEARKLVVLVTDAPPGGFCETQDTGRAHQYALQARTQCIRINAIRVRPTYDEAITTRAMEDFYKTTCGWYSAVARSEGNVVGAVLKMLYEPGYCECP